MSVQYVICIYTYMVYYIIFFTLSDALQYNLALVTRPFDWQDFILALSGGRVEVFTQNMLESFSSWNMKIFYNISECIRAFDWDDTISVTLLWVMDMLKHLHCIFWTLTFLKSLPSPHKNLTNSRIKYLFCCRPHCVLWVPTQPVEMPNLQRQIQKDTHKVFIIILGVVFVVFVVVIVVVVVVVANVQHQIQKEVVKVICSQMPSILNWFII